MNKKREKNEFFTTFFLHFYGKQINLIQIFNICRIRVLTQQPNKKGMRKRKKMVKEEEKFLRHFRCG